MKKWESVLGGRRGVEECMGLVWKCVEVWGRVEKSKENVE